MNRTIQSSTDYKKFSLMESNRKVYKPHVKRLVAHFDNYPQTAEYLPLLINERYQIADGQHRFAALQELKLPIYYIQVDGLTIEDARRLNAGAKPWSPMDYAKCFCGLGKKPYCFYVELKEKYKFNHDILLQLVSLEDPITGEGFRQGRLTSPSRPRTKEIAGFVKELQNITGNKHRALAFSLMTLWQEQVNIPNLLDRIALHYANGLRIDPYKDGEDYLRSLRTFV